MNSSDRKRLVILASATFFFFALLIAQFFKIQIVHGERWKQKALAQHQAVITEPFKRGTIWSNVEIKQGHTPTPQPLALDVPKFHLHIDPLSLAKGDREEIAERLWSFVDLPQEQAESFFAHFERRSRNRRVAMWLDRETRDAIVEWWLPYARSAKLPSNAIFLAGDYQRSRPFGKLAGQLLHTVRDFREEETKQGVPTGGLESKFHHCLSGKQGKRMIVRSPRQTLAMGRLLERPEDGEDLYLTINHYLQAIAEEEIEKGVKKAGGSSGWAVILEPTSGEVLALAHYPFFDPADYRTYFNSEEKIEHTRAKAALDPYEPGSVMKPITLAIALLANEELELRGEAPLFDPEEQMKTSDGTFPGRSKPLRDPSFHHYLNANMALQRSSNIYPARLVHRILDRLGTEWYREQLSSRFGLGHATGIELPAEAPGQLPRPGRLHANGRAEWSASTPAALAIGYNLLVTTVQMARIYAFFANGGIDVKPTLIKQERAPGEPLLPEKVARRVVEAMTYVPQGPGSSRLANIPGFTEAGKSGTAIKLKRGSYDNNLHIASFIGITPVTEPKLVIAVVVDETKQLGGAASGPIFREIARRSLAYLGVRPDDPFGYPVGDPRRDREKAHFAKECALLQEIYDRWNNREL